MKTLDCEHPTIALRLPPCAGSEPTVELTRPHHTTVPMTRVAVVGDDGLYHFSFPAPFPAHIPYPARGVWRLAALTGCGCYEANVYVNCPAPMFESVHMGTPAHDASQECCIDENDLLFTISSLEPPTVEVDGYPLAALLVNDAVSYALRLNDNTVTGLYTITNESGVTLASGTFGALGTTQYHPLDLTCATYVLKRPNSPEPV